MATPLRLKASVAIGAAAVVEDAPRAGLVGRHYTPRELARRMVGECFDALPLGDGSCRVLDPGCGDGVFLREALEELCSRREASGQFGATGSLTPAARGQIARESLFGVDVDAGALAEVRKFLRESTGASSSAAVAESMLAGNVLLGDALTGPGFGEWGRSQARDRQSPAAGAPPIDWQRDFPLVAQAGGFDLVIGNPPYLRERDAKPLFDRIAASELGRRWRQGRMDLWHYFVHRSLDLLRPGGLLCFVVNSYWTGSRGASRVIERLRLEATFEQIELLGKDRLFAGVSGQHMVFRLRKRHTKLHTGEPLCWIRHCPPLPPAGLPRRGEAPNERDCFIPHSKLFCEGRLVLSPPDRLSRLAEHVPRLAARFGTRQGIAENPPRINRRLAQRLGPQFTPGDGVFVLSADELAALALSPRELELLRPYYETASLGRYRLPAAPTHFILYLTPRTAPVIEQLPKIAAHLSRFRSILEARREVMLGRSGWWHLHWPRDEAIFLAPRILCVQMGRRPQFVCTDRPAFVGFSVNLVLSRGTGEISLPALTAILNSDLAMEWFERHAKRRGVNLEINGHLLRQFPLPLRDDAREQMLTELVARRQALCDDTALCADLDRQIEAHVQALYARLSSDILPVPA